MNNNYLKFNSWAYNYYLDRNVLNTECTLAIETSELDDYCVVNNCDFIFKEIILQDWSLLLLNTIENGLSFPKYFGLLALQCYAGAKMQNDGDFNASNYKKRFLDITGFSSSQDLDMAFKKMHEGIPIQEYIWIHAKKYLEIKHNLHLMIPPQSTHAGRYVKYPKSQIVLNQEDLKEYAGFYADLEKKYSGISELQFRRHYRNNIFNYSSTFIRKNNLDCNLSTLKEKIKIKQIFDSYCSGNWDSYNFKLSSKKATTADDDEFIVQLIDDEVKIYNSSFEEVSFSRSIMSKIENGDIVIFKKSLDYPDEFDLFNKLELDIEHLFVLSCNNVVYKEKLEYTMVKVVTDIKDILIYRGSFSKDSLPRELGHMVIESFPIKLKGFKISRRTQYLKAYPPEIINELNIPISVYHNGQRVYEYDKKPVEIGNYKIKIPGYSSLNFEIIDTPMIKNIVHDSNSGWKISSFSLIENTYDIYGFHIKSKNDITPLTINNWIKAQTNNRQMKPTNNLLLKVLNGCK